jgi:N-acetylneuraminic acid mutarotase
MHLAPNGKVFVSGMNGTTRYLDTSGTGEWSVVGNSSQGRDYGTSVMCDHGKVLIVGGGSSPPSKTAEVIDLNAPTPTWRTVGSMAFAPAPT